MGVKKTTDVYKKITDKMAGFSNDTTFGDRLKSLITQNKLTTFFENRANKSKDEYIKDITENLKDIPDLSGSPAFSAENLKSLDEKAVKYVYKLTRSIVYCQNKAKAIEEKMPDNFQADKDWNMYNESKSNFRALATEMVQHVEAIKAAKDAEAGIPENKGSSDKELELAIKFLGWDIEKGKDPKQNPNTGFKYIDINRKEQTLRLDETAVKAFVQNYLDVSGDRPKITVNGIFQYFIQEQMNLEGRSKDANVSVALKQMFDVNGAEWKHFKATEGNMDLGLASLVKAKMGLGAFEKFESDGPDYNSLMTTKFTTKFWGLTRGRVNRLEDKMDDLYLDAEESKDKLQDIIENCAGNFESMIEDLQNLRDNAKTPEEKAKFEKKIEEVKHLAVVYDKLSDFVIEKAEEMVEKNPSRDKNKAIESFLSNVKIENGKVTLGKEHTYHDFITESDLQAFNASVLNAEMEDAIDGNLPDVMDECISCFGDLGKDFGQRLIADAEVQRALDLFKTEPSNEVFAGIIKAFKEEKKKNPSITGLEFIENTSNKIEGLDEESKKSSLVGIVSNNALGLALDIHCDPVKNASKRQDIINSANRVYYYIDFIAKTLASDPAKLEMFENTSTTEDQRKAIVQEIFNANPDLMSNKHSIPANEEKAAADRWRPYYQYLFNDEAFSALSNSNDGKPLKEGTIANKIAHGINNIMKADKEAIKNMGDPKINTGKLSEPVATETVIDENGKKPVKYADIYPREMPGHKIVKMFKGRNVKPALKQLDKFLAILDKQTIRTGVQNDGFTSPIDSERKPNSGASQPGSDNTDEAENTSNESTGTGNGGTGNATGENQNQTDFEKMWKTFIDSMGKDGAKGQVAAQMMPEMFGAMLKQFGDKIPPEMMGCMMYAMGSFAGNPVAPSQGGITINIGPGANVQGGIIVNGAPIKADEGVTMDVKDAASMSIAKFASGNIKDALFIFNAIRENPNIDPKLKEGLANIFKTFDPAEIAIMFEATSKKNEKGEKVFGGKISDDVVNKIKECKSYEDVQKFIKTSPELSAIIEQATKDMLDLHDMLNKNPNLRANVEAAANDFFNFNDGLER